MGLREGVGERAPTTSAPQPAGVFRPDPFRVLSARIEFAGKPPLSFPGRSATRAEATKRGLRFEARVSQSLSYAHPTRFAPQLPLSFQTCSKRGRAIPDGILLAERESAICIIEIKARHTRDAWWQLERFYAPIAREAFPGFRICLLEICGVYDPATRLPKPVALLESVNDAFSTRECFHPVLVTRNGELHV